ncbi:protein sprouty [Musca domestica]|uniref:Protein sprouty n=1 Tax=Musca domestica TaxID=7370 RepID=A0ABM3UPR2_MUSDO|nr:protein sprouty [Musca domestica]XP_058975519.1 protein sprouty [Musca domestica]XP_058975520.1 protein sprouty [Musca domestica]
MDRRNGGDPLAPPRPPKLLPKIHRPRAPEPEMMNTTTTTAINNHHTTTTSAATSASGRQTEVINHTPQCTNQTDLSRNNNLNQQQQQQQFSINQQTLAAHNSTIPIASSPSTAATTSSNSSTSALLVGPPPPIRYNRVSCNNNHIGNIDVITQQPASGGIADDYQIHHLTYLPQRPSNLSRNGSQISSNSTTTNTSTTSVGGVSSSTTASTNNGIIAANSFTRRRPPPTPTAASPVLGNSAAVPLLTAISGSHHQHHSNNNFLNHFHTTEPVPLSTVTLAQPRPESERLGNEYVDTPLRTAQQLQNATRIQHPAGEHDNGQTTTHHLLLLPQRELRQQQQHQQQQHQVHHHHHQQTQRHATSAAGSATSALPLGIDGTDGILHSQHPHHNHHLHQHLAPKGSAVTGKLSPTPADTRGGFALSAGGLQPLNQPITKQPALSSNAANSCKFAKELPALDELLDMHNIATGIPTSHGMISAVNGASPLTGPMVIGGSEGPSSLNPITCPRCERCRCEQCQSPRPLPQTWVCNKTCLCSAESIIDYASCLCCAKALFYHCARDNDLDCDDGSGTPCVDNPCSCGPYKRTQRWGWLGALSLVLPCLWCYWPMRACVAACEKCYGRFARRGCRCQQIGSTSSMFPITSIGNNGNNVMVLSNGGGVSGGGNAATNASNNSKLHHHHNECNSAANRILRKGDLTPEKRLLDSSPEY